MTNIDHTGTSAAHTPTRWRGWPPARWFVLVIAIALTAVSGAAAAFLISLGDSTTCSEVATTAQVRKGELDLLLLLAVGAVPWGLALAIARRRRRLAVAGVIGLSPVLLALLVGLNPDSWQGSFCF